MGLIEDHRLLRQWATLMLKISIARTKVEGAKLEHGVGRIERVDDKNLFRSRGFRALRKWFRALSPGAKVRTRTWMRNQVIGVERMRKQVEAQGETFDYGEVQIDERAKDGELIAGLKFGDDAEPEIIKEGM